jgi:hypothetical protein
VPQNTITEAVEVVDNQFLVSKLMVQVEQLLLMVQVLAPVVMVAVHHAVLVQVAVALIEFLLIPLVVAVFGGVILPHLETEGRLGLYGPAQLVHSRQLTQLMCNS